MIQSKSSKEFVFSRRKPNLTHELTVHPNLSALLESDDISLSDCAIEGGHIGQGSKDSLSIDGSTLDRVNLSDTSYRSIVLTDARLVNCDLANLRLRRRRSSGLNSSTAG